MVGAGTGISRNLRRRFPSEKFCENRSEMRREWHKDNLIRWMCNLNTISHLKSIHPENKEAHHIAQIEESTSSYSLGSSSRVSDAREVRRLLEPNFHRFFQGQCDLGGWASAIIMQNVIRAARILQ